MSISTTVALISLNTAKKHLRIPTSNTSVYDTLGTTINQASKAICTFCNRGFLLGNFTEYYDGSGSDVLYPHVFPINSTEASVDLYISTDRQYTADQKIDSDDFVVYKEEGKVVLDGLFFYSGLKSVKVTYNAGYSLSSMPCDIVLACCRIVERIWKRANGGLDGVQSNSSADVSHSYSLEADIPDEIKELLYPYVRHFRG